MYDQECRPICVSSRSRSAARALAANRADNRACVAVINTAQKRRKKLVYEYDARAHPSGAAQAGTEQGRIEGKLRAQIASDTQK